MPRKKFEDVVKVKNTKQLENSQKKPILSDKKKNLILSDGYFNEDNKKRKSYNTLWLVSLITVVFLFFAIASLFSSALITINPKTKDFNVDKTLTATKNTNETSGLTYDLVVLSGEEKKEIKGSEEKNWEVSATGKVLFYNYFSSSPQTISQNTKLEGSNGKIYIIKNKVIIPGFLKKDGPGKIGADIYGEESGEEYNSTALDFKILGFKGTSKYSKIYARSVGDITGGLKGLSSQIGDTDKENAIKELTETLSNKLLEKAKNQIPKDLVLLDGATFLNIDEENTIPSSTIGSFVVSVKGTFNGILLSKEKLTKEVANQFLAENNTDSTDTANITINDIYITNIEKLSISSFDKSLINLDDMKDISFNLSGVIKVVWKVDENKIVADLLGKNKTDFNQTLLQFLNIDSADMVLKPFWRSSFPDKIDKIKVIVNYPR